jgi:hypothetical protein
MSCKSCQSQNQREFNSEIAIHFPGLKGLDKPIVWVYPKLALCLDASRGLPFLKAKRDY